MATLGRGLANGGRVRDLLGWRSAVAPRRLALKCGHAELDYAELERRVGSLAGAFLSSGVGRGGRVCLLMNPSETYVVAVHSLTRIGAVVVPLNVRQSPDELAWQMKNCGPSLILYDGSFSAVRKAIEGKEGVARFRWMLSSELGEAGGRRAVKPSTVSLSSLHSIIYTSGSTGAPKGVKVTLGNLLWNAISFGFRNGGYQSDRWLLVMPLFHVGGYTVIFRSLLHGSGIVLHPGFEPAEVSRSLAADRITLLSVVPTMLKDLLMTSGGTFPRCLRLVFLGGGPVPASLARMVRERRLPVVATYGMTETCSQVALSPPLSEAGGGFTAYRQMFPSFVAIRKGRRLLSAPEEVGEIVVRGPTIFAGYWRDREATSSTLRGGWFHTGDLGYLARGGGFVVLGRREDMIISGGENIYPVEVESSLLEHEAVEDAVVVGREDERWGQRVEAVVKLRDGFSAPSAAELKEFLTDRIGRYKIPKVYHFWSSLPKTHTGKTKREQVRERLERPDGSGGEQR